VHGAVQFGIPPETIKDSLTRFGSPPHVYVVPQQRFNLASGINVCEFEFATYFNFFVKGKPITLVCYPNQGEVLRKIADEIIEGPPDRELFYEVRLRLRVRVRVRDWPTLTLTLTQTLTLTRTRSTRPTSTRPSSPRGPTCTRRCSTSSRRGRASPPSRAPTPCASSCSSPTQRACSRRSCPPS